MSEGMAAKSEIARLAALISLRTTEIDEYLNANNMPVPSLDVGAPPVPPLPPHLIQARADILVATDELQALFAGPVDILNRNMNSNINTASALQALERFNILSYIKVGEAVRFEELAQKCGLDIGTIRQLMRKLISRRIFIEPQKDFIAHNGVSRLLVDDPVIHKRFILFLKDMFPVSCRMSDALEKWPASHELEETAHFLANGETFWDQIENDADFSTRFTAAMTYMSGLPEFDNQYLVDYLDWNESNHPKLVVDVGGHDGAIAAFILRKHPSVKCIVQDIPAVIGSARVPEDLKGRLEFQTHDFFTEQPVRADAYFFRSIFHVWPDKYAKQIVRNLIPALAPGVKIILNEVCLPEPGVVPIYLEQSMRDHDLSMRQHFNAKERSIDDWKDLFSGCDNRFQFSRLRQSPGSALALIEFVWET